MRGRAAVCVLAAIFVAALGAAPAAAQDARTSGIPSELWDPPSQQTAPAAPDDDGHLQRQRTLSRIDPESGTSRGVATVPGFPTAVAVGAGAAWVVDARNGTVTRLSGG